MCIKLNTINDVYKFVEIATQINGEVILKQKYYAVNGKSIMGVLSLDLTGSIILVVADDDYNKFKHFEI